MSHIQRPPCGTKMAVFDKESVSYDHKLTLGVNLATKLLLFCMCLSKLASFLLPKELRFQLRTLYTDVHLSGQGSVPMNSDKRGSTVLHHTFLGQL